MSLDAFPKYAEEIKQALADDKVTKISIFYENGDCVDYFSGFKIKSSGVNRGLTDADAQPEVIRCKDCKNYSHDEFCRTFGVYFDEDDFCSLARKKEVVNETDHRRAIQVSGKDSQTRAEDRTGTGTGQNDLQKV